MVLACTAGLENDSEFLWSTSSGHYILLHFKKHLFIYFKAREWEGQRERIPSGLPAEPTPFYTLTPVLSQASIPHVLAVLRWLLLKIPCHFILPCSCCSSPLCFTNVILQGPAHVCLLWALLNPKESWIISFTCSLSNVSSLKPVFLSKPWRALTTISHSVVLALCTLTPGTQWITWQHIAGEEDEYSREETVLKVVG